MFKDVDSIPLGVDFREHLDLAVSQCQVCLVVIGRAWLDVQDEAENHRLENPLDFVRIEIESALRRKIPVIPLLVGGASMPAPRQLLESLEALAYRNAAQVRADPDFHRDMDRVIAGIERHFDSEKPLPPPEEVNLMFPFETVIEDRGKEVCLRPNKAEDLGNGVTSNELGSSSKNTTALQPLETQSSCLVQNTSLDIAQDLKPDPKLPDEIESRIAEILSRGSVAPKGCWIETESVSAGFDQAKWVSRERIFTSKRSGTPAYTQYLGKKGGIDHQEAQAKVNRRNEIEKVEKESKIIKNSIFC